MKNQPADKNGKAEPEEPFRLSDKAAHSVPIAIAKVLRDGFTVERHGIEMTVKVDQLTMDEVCQIADRMKEISHALHQHFSQLLYKAESKVHRVLQ